MKKNPATKKSSLLTPTSRSFLESLINTPSPTWFERTGQKVWLDYMTPYVDETFVDTYGSAVATLNPKWTYKVVLEAHCDEISWFVNYITDDGLIYVIRNGGSDHQIAPSKRVLIHGKKWPVTGLFWRPAIHTRKDGSEEPPKLDNIFIDTGCTSKKEVEALGIVVWSVITYPDEFITLNDRYFVGRALDNRVGGFMIAQVARLLKEQAKKIDICIHFVNSVQEEIGLRWAEMMAYRLQPDLAIITDVCHDTSTPMIDKKKQGDTRCGLWPVLSVWPAVQNKLRDFVEEIATKKKVPFQRHASSRSTWTDTDAFAYTKEWIASVLISLPLRYMHTTVEMVHQEDVENTIKLMFETVCAIKKGMKVKYL